MSARKFFEDGLRHCNPKTNPIEYDLLKGLIELTKDIAIMKDNQAVIVSNQKTLESKIKALGK